MTNTPITVAATVLLLLMVGIAVMAMEVGDNGTVQVSLPIRVTHTNGEYMALMFVLLGLSACAAWFGSW